MYKLTSIDMSHVGGPIGSEYTSNNWEEYFEDVDKAKKFAEKDYAKTEREEKIKWQKEGKGWTSGDLRFVMYDIELIKIKK